MMVQNPPLDNCIPLTLMSLHNAPTLPSACGVAGVASAQVSEEWGRLCPTLSEGATPFLGGHPSAGAESGVV